MNRNELQHYSQFLGGLPSASTDDRQCRVCGCAEDHPCMTEDGPCFWLEQDLCSGCIDKEAGE